MNKADKAKEQSNYEDMRGWVVKVFLTLTTVFIIAVATQIPQVYENTSTNVRQDEELKTLETELKKTNEELKLTGLKTVEVLTQIATTVKYMREQGEEKNRLTREHIKLTRGIQANQVVIKTKQDLRRNQIDQALNHINNNDLHK